MPVRKDTEKYNISIDVESFATECSWDHVYIYDGWTIFDPLVAALSGTIKPSKRKVIAKSGNVMVHFYSDKHLNEEGFNLTYRISNCTNNTCSGHGYCNISSICECEPGWTGANCSIRQCCPNEVFNISTTSRNCPNLLTGAACPMIVAPRASHASAIDNGVIWVYGGFNFDGSSGDVINYDIISSKWSVQDAKPIPKGRFGHSLVIYNKKLYIFGGIKDKAITNELWEFDTLKKTWKMLTVSGATPVGVTGHAAVVVVNQMYVFMGYSSEKSFYQNVQQLDLDTLEWKIVTTNGALVTGTFGHSAVYDQSSGLIFVHGGFSLLVDSVETKKKVSSALFSFSPSKKTWTVLPSSNRPRMLHSSVIVGRMMIVYGGTNHHHENIKEHEKKCYSNDVLVYNIDCKSWTKIDSKDLFEQKGRFGQTAVSHERKMYVFGGFDGVPRNDLMAIAIGECSGFATKTSCLEAPFVSNCVWDKASLRCLKAEDSAVLPSPQIEAPQCNSTVLQCKSFRTCKTCLSNTASCAWCDNACGDVSCGSDSKVNAVTDVNFCPASIKFTCASLSTCYSCEQHRNCSWDYRNSRGSCKFAETKTSTNASLKCNPKMPSESQCHLIKSCSSCTAASTIGCMWCQSQNLCIDSEAYVVNFPYGQCLEWINNSGCSDVVCSAQKTCHNCFKLPACGWCDDASGTGIGKCMEVADVSVWKSSNSSTCPASRWSYTECPRLNCEKCKPRYYGIALNNGTCKECYCNNHGVSCDNVNGKCECDTAGLVGDHCERCDTNSYIGNASNGGHCFYRLQFGFQYNFNRTNKNHNFYAVPTISDKEVKFEVHVRSGDRAYMNLSYTTDGKEVFVVKKFVLGAYGKKFSAENFKIRRHVGPIFKIYLYNISRNTGFKRRRVELQEMASRPFSSITLCCGDKLKGYLKAGPTPIGIEPFAHGHAAVASVLIELPRSGSGYTPKGQSGLCVGSTVIVHRHQKLTLSSQQQLYIFKGRQKNRQQTPVNV
eukprot:gene12202-2824_t